MFTTDKRCSPYCSFYLKKESFEKILNLLKTKLNSSLEQFEHISFLARPVKVEGIVLSLKMRKTFFLNRLLSLRLIDSDKVALKEELRIKSDEEIELTLDECEEIAEELIA